MTHQVEINRILAGIGWTVTFHEFDPVYKLLNLEFCQLIFDSVDGFPAIENQEVCYNGPDPPFYENNSDPPHLENSYDPPHPENDRDPPHIEDFSL